MNRLTLCLALASFLLPGTQIFGQFAPAAGQPGTTAMYKDSSAFVGWASQCRIVRGLQDISAPAGPYASVGDSSSALGIAGTTGVVSLGDGGTAILRFAFPLTNGPGPDLAVFENGFDDSFLELAFVEASSDGLHYFRFPAVSNTDASVQTSGFGLTDPTKIHNLAGKYRALYGMPFDLSDIPDDPLLDKQAVTHIKIIDVVGCIQNQYCTRDANNNKVNDPWPTAFASGGFDLDAVGVIHWQGGATSLEEIMDEVTVTLFPNPASDKLYIHAGGLQDYSVRVFNLLGGIVLEAQRPAILDVESLASGIYTLEISSGNKRLARKFVKAP